MNSIIQRMSSLFARHWGAFLTFSLLASVITYITPWFSYNMITEQRPKTPYHVGLERAVRYDNQWLVVIEGGPWIAREIADEYDFEYEREVFKNHYIFGKEEITPKWWIDHHAIERDIRVLLIQQQFAKDLRKRLTLLDYENVINERNIELHLIRHENLGAISKYERVFNDRYWPIQWYEQDYRLSDETARLDLNLVPVYQELNITGRNVSIIIIDDGIEFTHDDIKDNFGPELSYNYNADTRDITPRYEDPLNKHGTRCAGELVMKPNNSVCGVGICYGARLGGVKLLDGETTDYIESLALQHALHLTDIYSGSWGPPDDGKAMDGPGVLSRNAMIKGIHEGRKGKGVLYVFAAGNGKMSGDNCAADGYINSIYTIAIASARSDGKSAFYSEECSAVHATTYSGGRNEVLKIITTDINNTCTADHSGTSAAAPIAAGILALALEANPKLTWRDCQHLLAWTSEAGPLDPNNDWKENGRNLLYNPAFGFGLINAYKLVKFAMKWINVPKVHKCVMNVPMDNFKRKFSRFDHFGFRIKFNGCKGRDNEVNYMEHLVLTVSIDHIRRGDVLINGTSPSGTTTTFMKPRPHDDNTEGFKNWSITSLETWGEDPVGVWKFEVYDTGFGSPKFISKVRSFKLTIYGTEEMPYHYNKIRYYENSNVLMENKK